MFRSVLAVLLGLVLAGGLVFIVEGIGHRVYPLPSHVNRENLESVKAYVKEAPTGALAFVPLAWFVGTIGGVWLATTIARRGHILHALAIGVLMLLGGLVNLVMLPSPAWFWIMGLAAPVVGTFLGYRLAPKRRPVPPTVLPVHPARG